MDSGRMGWTADAAFNVHDRFVLVARIDHFRGTAFHVGLRLGSDAALVGTGLAAGIAALILITNPVSLDLGGWEFSDGGW
jgi:hypothetical protein